MKEKIIGIFNEHTNNFIYTDDDSFEINGIDKNDYNEIAEEIVKLFAISDVSKQRELLIACSIKAQGDMFKSDRPRTVEESVDEFLSNL